MFRTNILFKLIVLIKNMQITVMIEQVQISLPDTLKSDILIFIYLKFRKIEKYKIPEQAVIYDSVQGLVLFYYMPK